MDLGYYVSALLEQNGAVNVPGLGNFSVIKAPGYYNDEEGRFYPPGASLAFTQQENTDDTAMVSFISKDKNISLPSARYFIERFVTELKQNIAVNEIEIGHLGKLFTDGTQLHFTPSADAAFGSEFFGLPPVQQFKVGQQPAKPQQPIPDLAITVAPATPLPPAPAAIQPVVAAPEIIVRKDVELHQEEDHHENSSRPKLWMAIVTILILLGAAAVALYFYKPTLFGIYNKQAPLAPLTLDTTSRLYDDVDSVKVNDTTASTDTLAGQAEAKPTQPETSTENKALPKPTPAIDTNGPTQAQINRYPYYVVFAGAFKSEKKANIAIKNYKSIGISTYILNEPGYGSLKKLVIGPFKTMNEAEAKRKELLTQKKLPSGSYSREITKKQ